DPGAATGAAAARDERHAADQEAELGSVPRAASTQRCDPHAAAPGYAITGTAPDRSPAPDTDARRGEPRDVARHRRARRSACEVADAGARGADAGAHPEPELEPGRDDASCGDRRRAREADDAATRAQGERGCWSRLWPGVDQREIAGRGDPRLFERGR